LNVMPIQCSRQWKLTHFELLPVRLTLT